jgi:hypothetical protein
VLYCHEDFRECTTESVRHAGTVLLPGRVTFLFLVSPFFRNTFSEKGTEALFDGGPIEHWYLVVLKPEHRPDFVGVQASQDMTDITGNSVSA